MSIISGRKGIFSGGHSEGSDDPFIKLIKLEILDQKKEFIKVKFDKHIGWVRKKYFITDSIISMTGIASPKTSTVVPFEVHGELIDVKDRLVRYKFSDYSPAKRIFVDISIPTGLIQNVGILDKKIYISSKHISSNSYFKREETCMRPLANYSGGHYIRSKYGFNWSGETFFVSSHADCNY